MVKVLGAALAAMIFAAPALAVEDVDGTLGKISTEMRSKLLSAVDIHLFDGPASRFRSLGESDHAVCGMINAKNQMGAYIGYKLFSYVPTIDQLRLGNDANGLEIMKIWCPDWKQ